jgi:transcriptional regulator with XRE-family HTH domain
MVDSITTRLREMRERAGLTMAEAAKLMGFKGASSYQRYENADTFDRKGELPPGFIKRALRVFPGLGRPPISREDVVALGGELLTDLNVRQLEHLDRQQQVWCIGEVAAGVWREVFEWPPDDRLPVTLSLTDTRWRSAQRQALRVAGDAMDDVYPSGSLIVFVRFADIGRRPQNGDRVIVLRKNRAGHTEATVKVYSKDAQGRRWLIPKSSNPQHKAILLDEPEHGETIDIMGLVVGSQTLE